MHANLASIMPQVVGVWCEAEGHEVTLVCYTGLENLIRELPDQVDLVFIGAFTEAALLAYALSNLFRSKGAVTVLGGPHARCYPEDASKYFDYVVGFTDQAVIRDVLQDCSPHRPIGMHLAAKRQPATLPGVRERWKFIEPTLRKAPLFKIVPMLGSLGCPYTCSFCIDSVVPYQPLDFAVLSEDLRFLVRTFRRPRVGWHDPNFGVRFDDYLDAIDAAVPPDSIDFVAESSLSLLSEPHLKRLQRSGFKALLPGIESWYDLGNKSKTGQLKGMDKVRHVSEHVNLILRYVPYVQTNFVLGLDSDAGAEPFELTKRFLVSLGRRDVVAAAQPAIPARESRAPVPVPFPGQQSRHERQAEELLVARLLRPRDRPDRVHVFLARHRQSVPSDQDDDPAVDERRPGGVVGGIWETRVLRGTEAAA